MAKRILIADDSVTIQKAFAMTFAGSDDVTVSGARSAAAGVPVPPPPAPAGHRSAASLPTAAIDDDEYGEISIDTGRESVPTIPRVPAVTSVPAAPSPVGRISSPSMPAVPMPPAAVPSP